MKSDIEIARSANTKHIVEVALSLGLKEDDIELYGKNKAKVNITPSVKSKKLILVTATSPTPQGEGKTTITIGIADALRKIGKNACITLREPSLGPVFGLKGGAAGGGYSQVIPMEEINLHFTGDFHAVTTANNLVSAIIDNHIMQGNELGIDPLKITWKRCIDLNDRALRNIVVASGGGKNGIERTEGFNITAASEMMAILCLSTDIKDFKRRVKNTSIGQTFDNKMVTCGDLKIEDAVTILMKEAIMPNLVQSLEGTPAFIHGGPFANIAHGCNSVIATKCALSLAEYVVSEAGFGADLGAEKFIDIKSRVLGVSPLVAVIVATLKAIKYNGLCQKENLNTPSIEFLEKGLINLGRHIKNITEKFGLPAIVALNRFPSDTDIEIEIVRKYSLSMGAEFEVSEAFSKGGDGAIELAKKIVDICSVSRKVKYIYDFEDSIEEKIEKVVRNIYGGTSVEYSEVALEKLEKIKNTEFARYPICIAKTQFSFTDDATILGAPSDFTLHIKDIEIRTGAEYIVVLAGSMLLMPGLSRAPAATKMRIDDNGVIEGLF